MWWSLVFTASLRELTGSSASFSSAHYLPSLGCWARQGGAMIQEATSVRAG